MYCDATDVRQMLGFSTTYTANTNPTLTQVNDIITNITAELNATLESIGITIPVTDANVLNIIERYCKLGSAGLVGLINPDDTGNVTGSQADYYYKDYKQFLKDIVKNPALVGISTGASSVIASNQITDGTYSEDDLNPIDQEFTF